MKELKPIMSRIKVLYCVFLFVMIVSVFFNTINIAHVKDRASFRQSVSEISLGDYEKEFCVTSFMGINFDSVNRSSIVSFDVDSNSRSKIQIIPSQCDVVMEEFDEKILTDSQNKMVYVANVILMVSWILYSVFFVVVVFVLGRAVVKHDIFNSLSVRLLRLFAVVLIFFWVASEVYRVIDYAVVIEVLERFGNFAVSSYKPNFAFLITSLLVYLFAELLAVGLRLKEDQDLTI